MFFLSFFLSFISIYFIFFKHFPERGVIAFRESNGEHAKDTEYSNSLRQIKLNTTCCCFQKPTERIVDGIGKVTYLQSIKGNTFHIIPCLLVELSATN